MRNSRAVSCSFALLLALAMGSAHAEPPNAQAALSRAQAMLKQLNDAKQQLEVDNAKLTASNASLEQQLKIARLNLAARDADVARRGSELGAARESLTRVEARKAQLTTRLEELVEKYKSLTQKHKALAASSADLERDLKATRAELADAEEKNRVMYETSVAILERYQHKSRWTALLQKEPFTGIKQVQVESDAAQFEQALREQLRDRNLDAEANQQSPTE